MTTLDQQTGRTAFNAAQMRAHARACLSLPVNGVHGVGDVDAFCNMLVAAQRLSGRSTIENRRGEFALFSAAFFQEAGPFSFLDTLRTTVPNARVVAISLIPEQGENAAKTRPELRPLAKASNAAKTRPELKPLAKTRPHARARRKGPSQAPSAAETRDQASQGLEAALQPAYGLTERYEWESELARRTWEFRHERADEHRSKAKAAREEQDRVREDWHRWREEGQRERFLRVADCGQTEIHLKCCGCGHEMTQLVICCQQWRLCRHCRGARASEYRIRFRGARQQMLQRLGWLQRAGAPGGRWGERFLTLTLPHSGDVRTDIQHLPLLWRAFRKQVHQYLRKDLNASKSVTAFPFVRVIEVTPGSDQQGHAHIHVWMFSPFFPHELLRMWWGRALIGLGYRPPHRSLEEVLSGTDSERKRQQLARVLVTRRGPNGRPLDPVPWPVVDVRACYGDVGEELVKYLVKDAERSPDGALIFIDPELYAAIYVALEGIRTIQTSRGFWTNDDDSEGGILGCEQCGGIELTSERKRRKKGEPIEGKPARSRCEPTPAVERGPTKLADVLESILPDCVGPEPPVRIGRRRPENDG